MLEFNKLKKQYGDKVVLDIDLLEIPDRDFIGLIGNNGAGKTTLLSLTLDLIKATDGQVKSKDKNVAQSEDWKSYTGSYLNESFLIPFLTPKEFLVFIGGLHQLNQTDVEEFISQNLDFFNETEFSRNYIRDLSQGNKNKLGILAAMISKPELLLLDEPFANLDPSSQAWLRKKLRTLNEAGTTIIISSHDLNHVTEICKRILLIEHGKIIKDMLTNSGTLIELEQYFQL